MDGWLFAQAADRAWGARLSCASQACVVAEPPLEVLVQSMRTILGPSHRNPCVSGGAPTHALHVWPIP
jgi:hypothetical protein